MAPQQMFDPNYLQRLHDQVGHLGRANAELTRKVDTLTGVEAALRALNVSRGAGGMGSDSAPDRRNAPMARTQDGRGYVSLDQIPGRHVPYDFMVQIPIVDGQTGPIEQSLYVSPDGPFVAVARYAIFVSRHTIQVTGSDGNPQVFFSRSYGRFRPISSAYDQMDAVRAFDQPNQFQQPYLGAVLNGANVVPVGNPIGVNPLSDPLSLFRMLPNWPGNGLPIIASPFSMSAGRSMTFDGLISVDTKGSQIRRQEIPVPSHFWTSPEGYVKLPTLDVFEPGEVVTVRIEPTHPNNPAYGNVQNLHYFNTNAGYNTFTPATGVASGNPAPAGLFPTVAGQFDGHEGVNAASVPGDTSTTTESVTRNATGDLYVGYYGYRILQGPTTVR